MIKIPMTSSLLAGIEIMGWRPSPEVNKERPASKPVNRSVKENTALQGLHRSKHYKGY